MSNRHAVNGNGKSNNFRDKCKLYRSTNRRHDNKIRRMKRHIKSMPGDLQAQAILEKLLK